MRNLTETNQSAVTTVYNWFVVKVWSVFNHLGL